MAFFEDDEKTEAATPRKRREARERGQVAQSQELLAALMLLTALSGLILFGGNVVRVVGGLLLRSLHALADARTEALDARSAGQLLIHAAREVGASIAPLLTVMLLVGFVIGYGQVGFVIAPKALSLNLARLSPLEGLRRIFGPRGLVRSSLALLKILAIAAAVGITAWTELPRLGALAGNEIGPFLAATGRFILRCFLSGAAVVLLLAILDFAFQRFQHERDLRMSAREVREELKSTEGDPRVRARIRAAQREMATRRMMEAVKKASVVVTNPTHFAVALRYERIEGRAGGDGGAGSVRAPVVVGKGADLAALRIRKVAAQAGVPLYEDPPLARTLYAKVEIGSEIPLELYEAVARVLAYVYRVQGMAANA